MHDEGEEGAEEHDVLGGGNLRFDAFTAVQHAAARLMALRRRESVSGNDGAGRVWKEGRDMWRLGMQLHLGIEVTPVQRGV